MMNVSSWSIRNPIPAVMLFVLLTFAGMLAFNAMKVQNFPDIDLPTVMVTAALPGASMPMASVTRSRVSFRRTSAPGLATTASVPPPNMTAVARRSCNWAAMVVALA